MDDGDRRGAGHEAGGGQGGRLAGGHERPRDGLDDPRLSHHRQAVDDLAFLFLELTHGSDSMTTSPDVCLQLTSLRRPENVRNTTSQ